MKRLTFWRLTFGANLIGSCYFTYLMWTGPLSTAGMLFMTFTVIQAALFELDSLLERQALEGWK